VKRYGLANASGGLNYSELCERLIYTFCVTQETWKSVARLGELIPGSASLQPGPYAVARFASLRDDAAG